MTTKKIIVQKFGGATLADAEKVKSAARRIASQARRGNHLIVVVSAMGKTTNQLIDLAHQVSSTPLRREMDMLLTVGERISMSLVSMALNDLGAPAISFTGSQAGILTDEDHVNAFIIDVKAQRVAEALEKDLIVILAGFQGVSPKTKEITTLGRGGSDTSAVAMAAAFSASHCEILKDVTAVYTADPNVVKDARPLHALNYDQLMEMTYWGAKVLHYRSVELAKMRDVPLYIGPAADENGEGTWVKKDLNMFESVKGLSLNSHETVLEITISGTKAGENLSSLRKAFEAKQIPFPQVLHTSIEQQVSKVLLTGPQEIMKSVQRELAATHQISLSSTIYSTVTLTCTGATSPLITEKVLAAMDKAQIKTEKLIMSAMSATVQIHQQDRIKTLEALHALI